MPGGTCDMQYDMSCDLDCATGPSVSQSQEKLKVKDEKKKIGGYPATRACTPRGRGVASRFFGFVWLFSKKCLKSRFSPLISQPSPTVSAVS